MLIRVEQFRGARPRRDPRLLEHHEAQVAQNTRLWSGALASWRKPLHVIEVGRNSLRYSNALDNLAAWQLVGITVAPNLQVAGDGSPTADKLREDASNGVHHCVQTVAKLAVPQAWTLESDVLSAERSFAVIAMSDGGGNYARVIINLASGALGAVTVGGTYVNALADRRFLPASGGWRVTLTATTGNESAVYGTIGAALDASTYSYAGTVGSGIYASRASLRHGSGIGAYRETFAEALPNIASIYLYKDLYWFVSSTRMNLVKGPIAGDSTDAVYFTGGPADRPSVTYDPIAYAGNNGRGDMPRQWYTMGLPAPASAPQAAIQPQTGAVTGVTSTIATLADQSTASFDVTGVTTDGYQVRASARFTVHIDSSAAKNLLILYRIKRGTKVIAETERKVAYTFDAGGSVSEDHVFDIAGFDAPATGTYTYTFEVTVTALDGLAFTATYDAELIRVMYTKTRITVGAGHPFVVGSRVSVTGVVGFESVNTELMEVVDAGSTFIWVDITADVEESYVSGGVWTLDFIEDERQDSGWVMTFLTQVGNHVQEGPPSAISPLLAIGSGEPVLLSSLPTSPPSDGGQYNITGKRIYRSNVSSTAGAIFQFVDEIPLGQSTYTDSKRFDELGEELPSTDWIQPPTDMTDLTVMYNGVLIGISGNQICASVPYQPHAWPATYRIAVEFTPVGLATFGENVLVTTAGKPRLIVGYEPGSLRSIPVELTQPIMSRAGLVDMGRYVAYPGDDGMVMVSSSGAANVTEDLFTREEWERLNPASMIGGNYDGRYVGSYLDQQGVRRGFIFDPRDAKASWTFLDFGFEVTWTHPGTGDLYLVIGDNILKWDAHESDRFIFHWRSKRFVLLAPTCPAYARVIAEGYPIDLQLFASKDPTARDVMELVHTETVQNGKPFALRGGYLSDAFEFELVGVRAVKEVGIGSSIAELQGGGRRGR